MKIVFVCKANVGRSQIAESFFKKLSKNHKVLAAGTDVFVSGGNDKKLSEIAKYTQSAKATVDAMKDFDPNFHNKISKQLTPEMVRWADKIIVMTQKKNLPGYMDYSKVVFWQDIPDGKDKSYDFICDMRDIVKKKVENFVKEIG